MSHDERTNPNAPVFESNLDTPGIRIWDPIDKGSFVFHTPSCVSLQRGDVDDFPAPIDSAVEFRTSLLEIPERIDFNVWDSNGVISTRVNPYDGEWDSEQLVKFLEIPTSPMKIYIHFDCPLCIRERGGTVAIELDDERTISIGCRSYSESPAGTITVTDDVEDVMRAVSLFGSALKTLRPERSFPTLRGHPPLIERGDEFSAPSNIVRPETGIRLLLPPERKYVYAATPLAYYLSAKIVPSDAPRLETPNRQYPLDGTGGFDGVEDELSRVFQHLFFLDCIIREEGTYDVPVQERKDVEPFLEFDCSELYERSLAEQVDAYLDVPFDVIEPSLPKWNLMTDVVPSEANVETLPFIADELSLVRCPIPTTRVQQTAQLPEITDFCRSVQTASESEHETLAISPQPATAKNLVWVGDGVPVGGNKATVESYRRRVEYSPSERSTIRVQIVCNDTSMRDEGKVREQYNFRDTTRHEVNIAYDLTVEELRTVFGSDIDYLHYIGHVNHSGIECTDGVLDTRTLDTVNVESFLLNACRSYEQSATLVEKGCRVGVATLSDVSNEPATKIGCLLARGLGSGLSFRSALSIAQSETLSGDQYVVIGDGSATLSQPFSRITPMLFIDSGPDSGYSVRLKPFHSPRHSAGLTVGVILGDSTKQYLQSSCIDEITLTADMLDEVLREESMPIKYDGDLYWSDDITAADLH